MNRAGLVIFALACALVLGALAWVTSHALALERAEAAARAEARLHEAMRLALWRMDSAIAPMVAREAARPYFHYQSFYPADRAYTRMFQEVRAGEVLVPSPLLAAADPMIRLHFQRAPAFAGGVVTSPEAPVGNMRDTAESTVATPERVMAAEAALESLRGLLLQEDVGARLVEACMPMAEALGSGSVAPGAGWGVSPQVESQSLNEYQARQSTLSATNRAQQTAPAWTGPRQTMQVEPPLQPPGQVTGEPLTGLAWRDLGVLEGGEPVAQGEFFPVWLGMLQGKQELAFLRVVRLENSEVLQGFWVDWPALRADLLARVSDLVPGASLEPRRVGRMAPAAAGQGPVNPGRLLAGIPAELVLPEAAGAMSQWAAWSPARTALLMTWVAVIGALLAVGVVLRASALLAARRGMFVSAVTHELRTPLTTFCLYSQMLADGMVTEEQARRDYLATLKAESRRLAGIVENVLAYARLVPGRAVPNGQAATGGRREAVGCAALLDSVLPVLEHRATQGGMDLVVERLEPAGALTRADGRTIERILYNLVDNAAKYASGGPDRRILLRSVVADGAWSVAVHDHGPGIPAGERRRVFAAFARGSAHAESAAQGLGLGLALARGLAQELGGRLRLEDSADGARFVLVLPLAV